MNIGIKSLLILLLLLIVGCSNQSGTGQNFEQILTKASVKYSRLLHVLEVPDGKIIFYELVKDAESSVGAAHLKKGLGGLKYTYSGGYINDIPQKLYSNFLKEISLVYGEIKDENITEVLAQDERNQYTAEIVPTTNTKRLWYIYPIKKEVTSLTVKGYNKSILLAEEKLDLEKQSSAGTFLNNK
ncbi:hypothetical protein FE784_22280 [Paenibacillus hemerocallicola]|uniref:Lipoprotein n=1 Tax=Paenibacillus hemerocallicola TaxID=1172614 RepID=A0A5C4T708_9BACL|nr:hypothetical protein [Paenibacillus hemerocallicola]TNJ64039.1 hypothetical protein FE784_22280 [Paenibacillus hemerocallicola]